MRVERYGVYWVSLDPVVGGEIAKTRSAAIISDDAMNQHLSTVVVCPLTSRIHPRWPSRVTTQINGKSAQIAVDQIRTVAKVRLKEKIGVLNEAAATSVRHVITEMYGVLSVSSAE